MKGSEVMVINWVGAVSTTGRLPPREAWGCELVFCGRKRRE